MKSSTWISGVLVLVAGVAGGWALHGFLGGVSSDQSDEQSAPSVSPADMAVTVATADVRQADFPVLVAALGMVQATPSASIDLTSRAGGRVAEVPVVQGQHVSKGDVVVRFDPTPSEATLAQARADLARAEAALAAFDRGGRDTERRKLEVDLERARTGADVASAQLARLVPLQKDGLVADRTVEETRLEVAQRELEHTAAEQALETYRSSGADLERQRLVAERASAAARVADAEAVRADVEVKAPLDGVVTTLMVRPGETTDPMRALARLLVNEDRRVQFDVQPHDAARLTVGARAQWTGRGGIERTGMVESIGAVVDEYSGLVAVYVRADDGKHAPQPGLAVSGSLEVERLSGALLVPERAIIRSNDQQAVVVASADGVAHIVPVTVRTRHEGVAAVEGELKAGDRVIVDGAYNLPEGAHVVPESNGSSSSATSDGSGH